MHILSLDNVSKGYGDRPLFGGVSFAINEGDKIGLIGLNGTGKSTLAAIVAGQVLPDSGEVIPNGPQTIMHLPQNPEFSEEGTVLQEVFLSQNPTLSLLHRYHGLMAQGGNERELARLNLLLEETEAWTVEANARVILTRLGLPNHGQPVAALSGGGRKRLALARALFTPCKLLILDEPTNHLDISAITWLEDYLSKLKGALLLITHDRYFLERVTGRIFELDRGELRMYTGSYRHYLELREEREIALKAELRRHKAALRRELEWLMQGAKARSTKEKIRKERIQAMREREFVVERGRAEFDIPSQRLGRKVVEMQGVSRAFGETSVLKDFSYILTPGERLGIVGPNSSGKSTILNLVAGRIKPDAGEIQWGQTVKVGYYDQESTVLDTNLRAIEYIEQIRLSVKTASGETFSAAKMMERFLFDPERQWTHIRNLSGGERRRLYLLGILMEEPNVLLLDEPTNDLDTETLAVLEDWLEEFPGAVIMVSHDRWFMDKSADNLLALDGQGGIEPFLGSFSEYAAKVREEGDRSAPRDNAPKRPSREKTKLSYKEQRELEQTEARSEELQRELEVLQAQLAEAGSDYQKAADLDNKIRQREAELEQAMERWLELQELRETLEGK